MRRRGFGVSRISQAMSVVRGRCPYVVDAVAAVGSLIVGFVVMIFDLGDIAISPSPISYVIVVVACAMLLVRRHRPLAVLLAVSVAQVAVIADTHNDAVLMVCVGVALFTVTRSGRRMSGLLVAVSVAGVLLLSNAVFDDQAIFPESLGAAALLLLPIALGDAARSREERLNTLITTAVEGRVQAERVRIARDLHDVVAHGLATIAVQSGVAAHLIDRDPDHAREALEIINETGRTSLEELRAMVGVLRSTDEAALRPTPADPNDLTDVVAGAARAGVEVRTVVTGRFPPDVSEQCVVAAHRIVQEALTNVVRHAGAAPSTVTLDHGTDSVVVTILNRPGSRATTVNVPSTGVGIVGMTERAESLHGTLHAERRRDGGFEVTAELPYRRIPSNGVAW